MSTRDHQRAESHPLMRATADLVTDFDARAHVYYHNGRQVPNVTLILESLGIIDYSNIPPSTREMALARGSFNHEAIEADLHDDLDESSIPEEWMGYLQASRQFRKDWALEVALVEQRFYHTLGYCGTLDVAGIASIASAGNKRRRVLIDWKSGTAAPWVTVQTAAYAAFFEDPATFYRVCVELHQDSTYRVFTFGPERWAKDWAKWNAYLITYRDRTELTW